MTKDELTKIIGELKNELVSSEARVARLKNILNQIESAEAARHPSISDTVDRFIEECCIEDPDVWESYELLYDSFVLFKEKQGIKTRILKRAFFAEMGIRGHDKRPGPGLYSGQPTNSISGIYLKYRRAEVEAAKARAKAKELTPEEIGRILEEHNRAEAEEQERRFNAIRKQADGEEEPRPKLGDLFYFNDPQEGQ